MAGQREAQKRRTRRLLIESGLRAFQGRGYAAATIDEIASGAGTTRTTFYLHFSSKTELMQAVLVGLDKLVAKHDKVDLTGVVASGERHLIRGWLESRIDQWPTVMPRLTAAFQAAAVEPAIDRDLETWFELAITRIRDGLDAAGRFAPESRHGRGVLAFGQLEALSRRWARRGWESTVERDVALEVLTDSWCALLAD